MTDTPPAELMNLRAPRSSMLPLPRSGEYAVVRYAPYTGPCDEPASGTDSNWPFAELTLEASATASARAHVWCDAVRVKGEAGEGVVYLCGDGDGDDVVWVRLDAITRARMGVASFRDRLVADDRVTRSELELVAALSRTDDVDACARLVELGLVDASHLASAFRETVREHLRALLSMTDRQATRERANVVVPASFSVRVEELLDPVDLRRWQALAAADDASRECAPSRHDEARIPLRRTAQVDTVNGTVMMTTLDISEAGMRLRASSLLPLASPVTVRLSVAGDHLELSGRVAHLENPDPGQPPIIVVLWTQLPAATEQTFARILEALY